MKNVVIAPYFTGHADWQRGFKWVPNYEALRPLIDSMKRGVTLVIIHDCFDKPKDTRNIKHIKVEPIDKSASFARWFHALEFLDNHPSIEKVWCVDSTDVEMINNPFPKMKEGVIYTGDEVGILDSIWMRNHHADENMHALISKYGNETLLNAGLLGGDVELVKEFIFTITHLYSYRIADYEKGNRRININSDMGLFNLVARTMYNHMLSHGPHVNTPFKGYAEKAGATAWWKHK